MKVFIANFGRANIMWPDCLRDSMIATVDDVRLHPYWEARDKRGYTDYAIAHIKTFQGAVPTRAVASRWYGLSDTLHDSAGDIWIHRDKDDIWWTTTLSEPGEVELVPAYDPERFGPQVYRVSKRCQPWSNRTRTGAPLKWDGLHPKAKDFLFTEGTLQKLADGNANYAIAMINGADLSAWHEQTTWKAKATKAKHGQVTTFDATQKTIWQMVNTAMTTAKNANGQTVQTILKDKQILLTRDELTAYLQELIEAQDRRCALTGIPLQFDGDCDDEMLCSLDRIDSDSHYERGNLQVVCRFANRWKSDSKDEEFRRLLEAVRTFKA